ncbi:MAG TPA: hypothetical protein V6D12_24415 [Candidatus Obscuribacterales bacterium]
MKTRFGINKAVSPSMPQSQDYWADNLTEKIMPDATGSHGA